jgi:hypothetical protein
MAPQAPFDLNVEGKIWMRKTSIIEVQLQLSPEANIIPTAPQLAAE